MCDVWQMNWTDLSVNLNKVAKTSSVVNVVVFFEQNTVKAQVQKQHIIRIRIRIRMFNKNYLKASRGYN